MIAANKQSGRSSLVYSYKMLKGRWWPFFGRITVLHAILLPVVMLVAIPTVFLPETLTITVLSMIPMDLFMMFFLICVTQLWMLSEPDAFLEETVEVFD